MISRPLLAIYNQYYPMQCYQLFILKKKNNNNLKKVHSSIKLFIKITPFLAQWLYEKRTYILNI